MADTFMPADGNPLNEQHLTDINASLGKIDAVRKAIALAERAGIDVTAQKAAADDAETKLRRFKQVYFPGR